MQTELTLHLDDRLVEKVDRWAKSRNLSLADAVASFLDQLPDPDQALELSPWTQQLVGVLAVETEEGEQTQPTDNYLDYLEAKYQ